MMDAPSAPGKPAGLVVLGATGQLGSDVVRAARARGVHAVALGHEQVDVADASSVQKALRDAAPDARAVVNAAAFHQVDKCEEDPQQAFAVNAVGALHVARAAKALDLRVVYVSTDYVFDGAKAAPYTEDDAPRPLNTYGASKLAGEHETRLANDDALVVRVASLFGVAGARGKGGNFIETILRNAKEKGALKVVSDQTMTPTYTRDAADAIVRLAATDARGVVHVTNAGQATWHALAREAVRLAGLQVPVEPVPASTWPSKAQRPANSALDTRKLARILGAPLRPWPSALEAYLEEKGHV
jgi:dTDP-4-dehydrorhamnose reductase